MKYGYARVSTNGQEKRGTSLSAQVEALEKAGAEVIFKEAYTGTKLERPQFNELLKVIQSGDELIITKLDRFARTAAEGAMLVQSLVNKGIEVNILNMGKADNTPMGKLMVNVMLSFAEFERDLIVERTQSGKMAARQRGIKVDGRPKKYKPEQLEHAVNLLKEYSYTEVEKMTGISKSTLTREVRSRKVNN